MGRGNAVSREIVESVADQEGCSPTELEPLLSTVIDPDALDSIFSPTGGGPPSQGHVAFVYHGYLVRVWADGEISVEETLDSMNRV